MDVLQVFINVNKDSHRFSNDHYFSFLEELLDLLYLKNKNILTCCFGEYK